MTNKQQDGKTEAQAVGDGLREALQAMLDEKVDYMLRNNLGNPYAERTTKQAIEALSPPASHDAQDGDHWSEFVVIERHWLQNIASAVCLLEQSESILDRREGAALRKLVASARSTPKPEAAGALTPAATPGEKEVKCRRCMDTQQEFNYNGDGPFPCRHCYDAQKEGNGNG